MAERFFNFKREAEQTFKTDIVISTQMDAAIALWQSIIAGNPPWLDDEDDIETINFAKFIAQDMAKKVCLDIGISVAGSSRATYLQGVVDELLKVLRDKVEDVGCYGGMILKPNGSEKAGNCIDYVMNGDFIVTETDNNGNVRGAIFPDRIQKGRKWYTRLEWQRYENGLYVISNRAFVSEYSNDIGRPINIMNVPEWSHIESDVYIENLDSPLFAYFKMPCNNTIDNRSPLGVPQYANAIKELKDLDIAWSRKGAEVEDSKHMTMVDISMVKQARERRIKLPRFIREYDPGTGNEDKVHEHTATMLTEQRIADINSILSMISTKCGYSQGQFVLDRKTGTITATQVESNDQDTVRTIKDIRDSLKTAIKELLYALNAYADLYNLAPVGKYEPEFAFGDLEYSFEQDKLRHWQYVQAGKYPLYLYYVKFEGMSEAEAKKVVEEAAAEQKGEGLFKEE